MQGTIRSYDIAVREKVIKRIEDISTGVARAMDCKVDLMIERSYAPVVNHATETEHVRRVATKWFGKEHLSADDLPLMASEDFGYFIEDKPGCFFTLGTRKPGAELHTLHSSDYDFNDDMVATGGYFWLRLLEDRLQVHLF